MTNTKHGVVLAFNKGVSQYALGKYEDAIKAYDKVIEINPQHTEAWNNKGVALDKLERYEDAIAAYDKVIGVIDPKHSVAWYNKGIALDKLGRYKDAIEAYNKALKINSQYAEALYNKGIVLSKLRRYEDAIRAYDKAIEIDPKNAVAWYNKGVAFGKLRRHEDAIQAYDKAIKINPQYAEAWNNKGVAICELKELERYEDAIEAYDKAIKISPQLTKAWNNKGATLGKLGRYEDAIRAFDKIIEINPEKSELALAHSNLGELFLNLGNLEDASKKLKEALDIDERHAHALSLQGRIRIEEQDYNGANISFKKAISIDVGNPLLLLWDAYANYLNAEFSSCSNDKRYQEKIVSIIRAMERAENLAEKYDKEEIRAYILYFLGCFYYKSKDIFVAKAKLNECITLKSPIKSSASELLGNIWNYQIRPSWWQWWLASPFHRYLKRIIFGILSLSIFALLLLHPFIPVWFPSLQVNWTLYIFFILLLIIILIFPSIESVKTKDFEIEIRAPPPFEFVLSHAIMEERMKELETYPVQ